MRLFLDLFAGIGGFALGAEWSGLRFDAHYFSEVDPYAIRVYTARFPDAIPLGDIRAIQGADLPSGDWIIAGGFPCQDISVAGKGAGLEGERSGLWYEYARIIGELRPRYAIMENVGALAFRGLDSVLGSLAEIGYDAEWQDIRASDVGAPHRRERIWIIAYPGSEQHKGAGNEVGWQAAERLYKADFPDADDCRYREPVQSFGERGGGLEADARGDGEARALADAERSRSFPGTQAGIYSGEKGARPRDVYSQRCSWWATEPDVGRVAHGVPARVDRLKCLGNSIVPQIAELIFAQIKETP